MAVKKLDSGSIAAFCESVAVMYSAGIQTDEAVSMLSESMGNTDFKRACEEVYKNLIAGKSFTESLRDSGRFPSYVVSMVGAGEHSGRLESVLRSLASYYDEEQRLFAKIKSAIAYPAALLCIMSIILLFTVFVILPVFTDVYENFAGEIASGSFSYVAASMIIGDIALIITLVITILVIIALLISQSSGGQRFLIRVFEKMPFTRRPLRQLAICRFTTALSTCIAAGIDTDTAMDRAMEMVDSPQLLAKLEKVKADMLDRSGGKNLAQAIYDNKLFDPMYGRMLLVGSRAGSLETVLTTLSETFFEDSVTSIDGLIDSVEPTLAAFLTISVGCTLVAVMLPLIGIMGSIG